MAPTPGRGSSQLDPQLPQSGCQAAKHRPYPCAEQDHRRGADQKPAREAGGSYGAEEGDTDDGPVEQANDAADADPHSQQQCDQRSDWSEVGPHIELITEVGRTNDHFNVRSTWGIFEDLRHGGAIVRSVRYGSGQNSPGYHACKRFIQGVTSGPEGPPVCLVGVLLGYMASSTVGSGT